MSDASMGAQPGMSVKWVEQVADPGCIGTRPGMRWMITPQERVTSAVTRRTGRPRIRS